MSATAAPNTTNPGVGEQSLALIVTFRPDFD